MSIDALPAVDAFGDRITLDGLELTKWSVKAPWFVELSDPVTCFWRLAPTVAAPIPIVDALTATLNVAPLVSATPGAVALIDADPRATGRNATLPPADCD